MPNTLSRMHRTLHATRRIPHGASRLVIREPGPFLAKLATKLAKPKGVRVLLRRDEPCLLASTPATKIPGCGAGSAAAKQFAAMGANSILDLRRFNAAELRERLGEQLGLKVYDRCRGIDHDPVEPTPIPSKVSSQLSLVPLIAPASCLGKPGEKLTPVFPWQLERVKPFLVTLVDDLMDRMKEELAERDRRPTKFGIEHHLHQRGSKSQSFVLPIPNRAHSRHRVASATSTSGKGAEGQQPQEVLASQLDRKSAGGADLLGLPRAALLVELALTPFKKYRDSRRAYNGGGPQDRAPARELGRGQESEGEMPRRDDMFPPVVKLIVSVFGFESAGPASRTAAPPDQRTLRDMMWMGKDATSPGTAAATNSPNKETSTTHSGNGKAKEAAAAAAAAAAAKAVAPSPVACVRAEVPPSTGLLFNHLDGDPAQRPKDGVLVEGSNNSGSSSRIPRTVVEKGTVLVRCPRCKACLPVGEPWDAHREEHISAAGVGLRRGWPDTTCRPSAATSSHVSSSPPQSEAQFTPASSVAPAGTRIPEICRSMQPVGGDVNVGSYTPSSCLAAGVPAGSAAAARSGGGDERLKSARLSDLLKVAVTPEQAADVLRRHGLLRDDGQTRFADLGLVGDEPPSDQ